MQSKKQSIKYQITVTVTYSDNNEDEKIKCDCTIECVEDNNGSAFKFSIENFVQYDNLINGRVKVKSISFREKAFFDLIVKQDCGKVLITCEDINENYQLDKKEYYQNDEDFTLHGNTIISRKKDIISNKLNHLITKVQEYNNDVIVGKLGNGRISEISISNEEEKIYTLHTIYENGTHTFQCPTTIKIEKNSTITCNGSTFDIISYSVNERFILLKCRRIGIMKIYLLGTIEQKENIKIEDIEIDQIEYFSRKDSKSISSIEKNIHSDYIFERQTIKYNIKIISKSHYDKVGKGILLLEVDNGLGKYKIIDDKNISIENDGNLIPVIQESISYNSDSSIELVFSS